MRTVLTVLANGPSMLQLGSHAVPESLPHRSFLGWSFDQLPTAVGGLNGEPPATPPQTPCTGC